MRSIVSETSSNSQHQNSKQQQQRKLQKIQSNQKSVKTIMVKTVPVKLPQVASAGIRMPLQNINQTSTKTTLSQPPTEVSF